MDPASAKPPLTEALNQLWARFLPEIEEKVAVLSSAAAASSACQLSIEQQEAARDVAHKLAGVLGVFGLAEGTNLAREAEILCTPQPVPDPLFTPRLTAIASELQSIIANRG
jgi:HPt (histidine-containing phosphotransfer) domain-containing protein